MKNATYQHHGHRAIVSEDSYFFYLILIASAMVLLTMIIPLMYQRFEGEPNIFDIPIDSPFYVETSNYFSPGN